MNTIEKIRYELHQGVNTRRDCVCGRRSTRSGQCAICLAEDLNAKLEEAEALILKAQRAIGTLLPYVEDQVRRDHVAGQDTSHFGDARAVREAHEVLALIRQRGSRP